jgi:hypothetical protein
MHILAIHAHSDIPTNTWNTCTYMQYTFIVTCLLYMSILAIHAHGDIPTYTNIYILLHIHAILMHTYTYMPYRLIPAIHALHVYTCTYMHIHAITQQWPTPSTWNGHISATNYSLETSQRTDLITASDRLIVLVCGIFHPFATIWRKIKIDRLRGGHLWCTSLAEHWKKASDFSMRVGGQSAQVSSCLNDPGRFYGCGKTDQKTNSFKVAIFDAP